MKPVIQSIVAEEILDSRGNPTIQTTVVLSDGSVGTGCAPSGASVGTHEAFEIRDSENTRYNGLGVLHAIENVKTIIQNALKNKNPFEQENIDALLIKLDGTTNKSNLGANALISVSIAVAKAAAYSMRIPLFAHIQKLTCTSTFLFPYPLFNIINGGKHAQQNLDFQEYIITPVSQSSFAHSLEKASLIYHRLKKILIDENLSSLVGDEGGFAPYFPLNTKPFEFLKKAIEEEEMDLGKDFSLGLDVAASTFYKNNSYFIRDKETHLTSNDLITYYEQICNHYPIAYLEDGLSEDDWSGWNTLCSKLSQKTLIVGDDLTVTNPQRLKQAIEKKAITGIIIKPNQIGTISEAIRVVDMAKKSGIVISVSHRSGETNDDFIADFAVGVGADFVKFGAPARGERLAKYNRLLQIERLLKK